MLSSPCLVSGQRSSRPGTGLPWRVGRVVFAMVLSTAAAVTLAPTGADAAFPGANGVIVFASSRVGYARWCPSRHEGDQLFALPAGGSGPLQLTCNLGSDQHPFVSPDGSEVVFSKIVGDGHSQLFTIPLSSSTPRRPPRPTLVSDSSDASDDYPSWSPTGDGTIVFQRTTPGAGAQLYIENVSSPSAAAPVFSSPTGHEDTQPVFDPSDPELIAFVRLLGGHSHIFSYDLSSHVLTDLSSQGDAGLPGNDSKPDYAATGNGGRIVFQSDRLCDRMELYTMTSQGTDQTAVFPTSRQPCNDESNDPVYSPEGDALAFDRRGGHGATELFTVSVSSSGQAEGSFRADTDQWAMGQQPTWGPAAQPPAQAPEIGSPVIFPLVGTGIILAVLGAYRRNTRRERRPAMLRRQRHRQRLV